MKKILPLIIILGFLIVACSKKIESDSYWLAIKSYPIPPLTGNSIFDGTVLHFENDSIGTGNIFIDRIGKQKINIRCNEIFINDTLTFEIFDTYADSLILDYGFDTRLKFIKLEIASALKIEEGFFNSKHWELTFDKPEKQEFNRKLILTNLPFYENLESYICIEKNLSNGHFSRTTQKWKFQIINGDHLFVKTSNQLDNEFYRITEYLDKSSALLECVNCIDRITARMKRINDIDILKRREIIETISNKKWRISHISKLDTISISSRFADSIPINLNSIKNQKLNYLFSGDLKFEISESGISKETGNWNLSSTGQEIIIKNGLNPSDYIDLISVNPDSLVIGNLRLFASEKLNFGQHIEMYYQVTLKK